MLRFKAVYQIIAGVDLGDPATWNVRFSDIDSRLNALEQAYPQFTAAQNDLITQGIAQLNLQVTDQLDPLQAQINTMQTTVNGLQTTINDQMNSVTTQLNDLLTTAQGIVSDLESLGTVDGGTF